MLPHAVQLDSRAARLPLEAIQQLEEFWRAPAPVTLGADLVPTQDPASLQPGHRLVG